MPATSCFTLKNPADFPVTFVWFSNGGRYYSPWNRRHLGVLGLEEGRAYSAYGHAASIAPNPLSEAGIPTALQLSPRRRSRGPPRHRRRALAGWMERRRIAGTERRRPPGHRRKWQDPRRSLRPRVPQPELISSHPRRSLSPSEVGAAGGQLDLQRPPCHPGSAVHRFALHRVRDDIVGVFRGAPMKPTANSLT